MDNKTLGHKNSIPLEPYLKWVRTRAQSLMMPYPHILPVIKESVLEGEVPYTLLHPACQHHLKICEGVGYSSRENVILLKPNSTPVRRRFWNLLVNFTKRRLSTPTSHQRGCATSFYLRILYYLAQGVLMYSQFYLINMTCVSFLFKKNLNF